MPNTRQVAEVHAGDNSVVKATINRPTTVIGAAGNVQPTQSAANVPMIHVGADSVVKAEIDASTHHHTHHSKTVHGQYIENQTLVHVGAIVQQMTVSFSSESASEIERSLPGDPSSLISILAETYRFLIRNDTLRLRQHVKGGIWKNLSSTQIDTTLFTKLGKFFNGTKTDYEKAEQQIESRHALCLNITTKLHGIAATTGDKTLAGDIESIDECVLSVTQVHDKIKWLDKIKDKKKGPWPSGSPAWFIPVFVLLEFAFLLIFASIPLGIIVGGVGIIVGGVPIWRIRSLQSSLGHDLARADSRLAQLVLRHEYKSPIINLLCAVATADGQLTSDEARNVRTAIAKLGYSVSDTILTDCLAAWRLYAQQNTVATNTEAVLKDIGPLSRTESGKRVFQAAVAVAKSDELMTPQEKTLLRSVKTVLDID